MSGHAEEDRPTGLVVGGNSLVGQALASHLRARGWSVTATTRRRDAVGDGDLYLDLENGNWSAVLGRTFRVAFLAAAVARLADCVREPERSKRINVEQTAALAERLVGRGTRVVFLSTNQVFDGRDGWRTADEPVSPVTVYGRQKADAEAAVLAAGSRIKGSAAVLRMTKILDDCPALFLSWAHAMAEGRPITPFMDMTFAPVHARLIARCLERIGLGSGDGIYQISADHDVTYADAGYRLAERMGVPAGLVRPVLSRDSGVLLERPAAKTTLDSSRIAREFGIAAPDPWEGIDSSLAGVLDALAKSRSGDSA